MPKEKDNKITVQSSICSDYDVTSICSCDREVVSQPTSTLLHQQSRFFLIKEGKGKIKIQGSLYELQKGSLVSILPYQYSEITEVTEPLVLELIVYNFYLFNETVKVHLNFFNEDISLIELIKTRNVVSCDEKSFLSVDEIFLKLKDELGAESLKMENKKTSFSGIYVSSLVLELITIFERQTKAEAKSVDAYYDNHDLIIQYIYLHLGSKMTLNDLSHIFFMSESAISSYIYKRTGLYFTDLLYQMKMARMKNFLLYTGITLDEMAEVLGFTDSAHISKVFLEENTENISHYRKTYNKINKICKSRESKISYEIVDYIYQNYAEDLNAAVVADKFRITVSDLNYHLKYLVEKNFDCFLNYVRINKSVKLLLDTKKSIPAIAEAVGYRSLRSYDRNFKRFYNTNPVKFRQNVKIENS